MQAVVEDVKNTLRLIFEKVAPGKEVLDARDVRKALNYIIEFGHFHIVRIWLHLFKITTGPSLLQQALVVASRYNQIEIVQYCLDKGADVNTQFENDSPLCMAVSFGHFEIVKLLIAHHAYVHESDDAPLRLAIIEGYFDIVQFLVNHGANIYVFECSSNTASPMICAIFSDRLEILKFLIAKHRCGVHAWDQHGPDAPLRHACQLGRFEIVKFLLEHGANVVDSSFQSVTAGHTPLWNACYYGAKATADQSQQFYNTIKLLLIRYDNLRNTGFFKKLFLKLFTSRSDADVHSVLNGPTIVLPYIAELGSLEIVSLLLQHGADVHYKNDLALKRAAENGHLEVTLLLTRASVPLATPA